MLRTLILSTWLLTGGLVFGSRLPRSTAPVEHAAEVRAALQVPPGNLPFFYDLYTFRGEESRTTVVGAYAIPANRLHGRREGGFVEYEIVVSLVVADTAAGSVRRTDDSVTVRLPRAPSADRLVTTHLEVNAPPSRTTVQRVIMSDTKEPGYGQLYQGTFNIPDYSGSHLMLSDVALGEPGAERSWTRGDMSISLLPTGRLPEGFFSLYYEIYNLPAGNRYSTEITIERMEEDRDPDASVADEVRIRFSSTSTAGADAVLREFRRIESLLQPGVHRLSVLIRDETTGQTAERARSFRVGG